ncbi:hypothetical protein B0H19DRAFT_1072024 [Mycena capillaripes]|nr:hypothetical protein B0H19DRAFT_1072024 [Mycena capillaripes]
MTGNDKKRACKRYNDSLIEDFRQGSPGVVVNPTSLILMEIGRQGSPGVVVNPTSLVLMEIGSIPLKHQLLLSSALTNPVGSNMWIVLPMALNAVTVAGAAEDTGALSPEITL